MNVFRMIKAGVLILLLVLSESSLADIAPDPMTAGKALHKYDDETTEVRMVAEDVLVRVFEHEIVTVAEFSMYNEGGAVTMQVGFPYSYEGEFIEFRAFVNGREVDTRDGKKEIVGKRKVTVFWKLWDMTFENEKSYDIRVEYKTKTFEMEHGFIWTESYTSMSQGEIDEAQRLMRQGMVSYWLGTGMAWKGVLDKCRVEFEFVGKTDDNIQNCWPEGGRFTGNGVLWEYSDYEPTGRINARYYPNMAVKDIPPYMLDLLKQYPDDPYLASSIGTVLRSDLDRKDLTLEVYHSFLARWDEPIPQLIEYASGGRCRYNFKGAGGDFYTIWRIAKLLFMDYERMGMLEKAVDIAPTVSKICSAIADSLDTCGNLPENNAKLYEDAIHLLNQSNRIIEEGNR